MKSLSRDNQIYKEIQTQILNELSIQNPDELVATVSNLRDNYERYAEITDSICQILNLENEEGVVETVDQLLRDKNDFERRVANSVNNPTYNGQGQPNPQLSLKLISDLKQVLSKNRDFSGRLLRLLQIDTSRGPGTSTTTANNSSSMLQENDDSAVSNAIYNAISDLIANLADMNNREELLMTTLQTDSPDNILKRIDEQMLELSKYTKLLESLANLTQADGSAIVDKVQDIIKENNELRNNQKEICDQLKLSNVSKVGSKLRSLSQSSNILSSLCQMLNVDSTSR